MPNALASLIATIDNWGGNIALEWTYPSPLPNSWQLFIFKKAGSAVTDAQITDYFAGNLDDQTLRSLGIYVFRNLPTDPNFKAFVDWGVQNDTQYFYVAVIRDLDASTSSDSISANAQPEGNIVFKIPDTKSLLIRALEKAISGMRNVEGDSPILDKHFKVKANYPREKVEALFIVVSRMPGQSAYRFFSEEMDKYSDRIVRGEIEIQVMEIAWVATGNPAQRDRVTLLMMGYKQIMKHYLMRMGAGDIEDVRFILGGDTEGEVNGELGVRGTMTAVFVVVSKVELGGVQLGWPVTNNTTYIGD